MKNIQTYKYKTKKETNMQISLHEYINANLNCLHRSCTWTRLCGH